MIDVHGIPQLGVDARSIPSDASVWDLYAGAALAVAMDRLPLVDGKFDMEHILQVTKYAADSMLVIRAMPFVNFVHPPSNSQGPITTEQASQLAAVEEFDANQ